MTVSSRPTYHQTYGTCAQQNESEFHNSGAMSTVPHTLELNNEAHAVSTCLTEALYTLGSNENGFEDNNNWHC